jgi:hypothetical protein
VQRVPKAKTVFWAQLVLMDLLAKLEKQAQPAQLENAETLVQLAQLVKLGPKAQLVLRAILAPPETKAQRVLEHCRVIPAIPAKPATPAQLVQ